MGPHALVATMVAFLVMVQERVLNCADIEETMDVYDHAAMRLYNADQLMSTARRIHSTYLLAQTWRWGEKVAEFELRQLNDAVNENDSATVAFALERIPRDALCKEAPCLVRKCISNSVGRASNASPGVAEEQGDSLQILQQLLDTCSSQDVSSVALRSAVFWRCPNAMRYALEAGGSAADRVSVANASPALIHPRVQDEAGVTALHLASFRDDSVLESLLMSISSPTQREEAVNLREQVFGLAPLSIAAGLASEKGNALMKRWRQPSFVLHSCLKLWDLQVIKSPC